VPIGHRFIVDFLAPSLKLVVEVDGSAHQRRRRRDARRHEQLRRLGYRVLRIRAVDAVRDVERMVEGIGDAVVEGTTMERCGGSDVGSGRARRAAG